jgi:energy-coupling factor transport system ATP-binding protein
VSAAQPAPAAGPTLELRGVTYRYPGERRPALSGIDLRVAAGEIVGVAGPNEAGKSTLCLVAAGIAPGSAGGELEGEVVVAGTALRGLRAWEIASLVGIVFADPASQLSGIHEAVRDEIGFGPLNLGLAAAEAAARAERVMALLGVAALADRDPRRLSGGEQQLVAIASMLAMQPRALVLDEPVAELDPNGRRLVSETLRSLAGAGTAILVAEHDADFLASTCDRVVSIDGGSVA